MRARLIAITCAAALFAGAIFSQRQANSARAFESGDELLYLPNARLLKHFTGGMNHIVADLLWLQCIQYIGKESKGDRKFTWLQQMLETVVHLDPWFDDAYRYGGMFLAALRADDDLLRSTSERGFIANPDNFQLPYELAMIFLLNRRTSRARERATYYLSLAAAIEGSPSSSAIWPPSCTASMTSPTSSGKCGRASPAAKTPCFANSPRENSSRWISSPPPGN